MSYIEQRERIAENIAVVRQRIADAAARAETDPADIDLVAVTKYVGVSQTRAVFEAGCRILGESRPQHFWPKAETLLDLPIEWHMIGHLQRNKVRRTLPLISMIESVDNMRLLESVDRIAAELSLKATVLLEVNISGELEKHGFKPAAMRLALEEIATFSNVEVRGLMGMAALAGGADAARRYFSAMRELRDELVGGCPDNVELKELSMGMSRDYEMAIEEGATIVRVGSALYEGVPLNDD